MRALITNKWYWLMGLIGVLGFIAMVGMPPSGSGHFWLILIASKIVGAWLIYADIRLFLYLAKHGKIDDIKKYVDNINE